MYTSHSIDGWWLNVIRAVLISGCVQNISNTNNTLFDGLTICFTSWPIYFPLDQLVGSTFSLISSHFLCSLLLVSLLEHLIFTRFHHILPLLASLALHFYLVRSSFSIARTSFSHISLHRCYIRSLGNSENFHDFIQLMVANSK